VEGSTDHDGVFEIRAEREAGELARRTITASNGESAARREFFAGGKLARVELDENGDGRTDLWNFYEAGEHLVRQEQDANGDGKVDSWVELDPRRAGRRNGATSGDGKRDFWRTSDAEAGRQTGGSRRRHRRCACSSPPAAPTL
jgi:hypothetical protein